MQLNEARTLPQKIFLLLFDLTTFMKIDRGNLPVFPFQSWVDVATSLVTKVGPFQSGDICMPCFLFVFVFLICYTGCLFGGPLAIKLKSLNSGSVLELCLECSVS